MAKSTEIKRAAEGGAALVAFTAANQALMDRSGSEAAVVLRNGAIGNTLTTLLGVAGAWLGRKQPLVAALGYGAGAAGISGLTAIGTQLVDEKLRAKAASTAQTQLDQVGEATGNQPSQPEAPTPRAARAAYVDDSGFDSSI